MDFSAVMEDRPARRGYIWHGTSSNRNALRCSTTNASISGYSSGKLRLKTSSALRFTPTKPDVGSCTGLPKIGRSTSRKNRIPSERIALVLLPCCSTKRDPMTM